MKLIGEFTSLNTAIVISLIAFWLQAILLFFKFDQNKQKTINQISFGLISLGIFVSLSIRGVNLERFPIANLYESLLLTTLGISVIFFILNLRNNLDFLAWPVLICILGLLMTAAWLPSSQKDAIPLIPALRSYWRAIHVPPLLFSYGFFLLASIVSIFQLVESNRQSSSPEALKRVKIYQDLQYRFIVFGFPLLTFGIVTGALWANKSWGNLWQWDPKENLALVTWFCYLAFIHLKTTNKASANTLSYIVLGGLFATYMTYLGINQFNLGGLHTYGRI